MTTDIKFVKGLFIKRRDNAPDFVIGNLSLKTEEFIEWLTENTNEAGFCNIDLKTSKAGKMYAQLNEWKKEEFDDKKYEKKTHNPVDDGNAPF